MPETEVVFYQDDDAHVPVLDWLNKQSSKVQDKCMVRIERLQELGYELRRPEADLLRDEIYELRIGFQGIHYRILYFFYKDQAAVLAHAVVKTKRVPPRQIDLAVRRKAEFIHNPKGHTYQ